MFRVRDLVNCCCCYTIFAPPSRVYTKTWRMQSLAHAEGSVTKPPTGAGKARTSRRYEPPPRSQHARRRSSAAASSGRPVPQAKLPRHQEHIRWRAARDAKGGTANRGTHGSHSACPLSAPDSADALEAPLFKHRAPVQRVVCFGSGDCAFLHLAGGWPRLSWERCHVSVEYSAVPTRLVRWCLR